MTPSEKFVSPVEGYGFNTPARFLVAMVVLGLLVSGARVALANQQNWSALWQVAVLAFLVILSGWQIVFVKRGLTKKACIAPAFGSLI
jgi:hypothetical protein